jgi:hypothetical protein
LVADVIVPRLSTPLDVIPYNGAGEQAAEVERPDSSAVSVVRITQRLDEGERGGPLGE